MIVPKFSKSYDTADGSEQSRQDGATPVSGSGQTAAQRWADDGGPCPAAEPPQQPTPATKPAWSVLSLNDLEQAIRRAARADDPENERQRQASSAREDARAEEAAEVRRADAARAWHDRYRNAWEHT
jgi:hypothetical protein